MIKADESVTNSELTALHALLCYVAECAEELGASSLRLAVEEAKLAAMNEIQNRKLISN